MLLGFPKFITLSDGYKLDHRRQYPKNTRRVFANLTARYSRVDDVDWVYWYGGQGFLQRIFMECAQATFFQQPKKRVVDDYKRLVDSYLGPNDITTDHIAALHDYGVVPMKFWSIPEGSRCPLRMPPCVFENSHDDFAWVTNYFETIMSTYTWPMSTSLTTACRYRDIVHYWANRTGGDPLFLNFQCHDFSFRGMMGWEAAAMSGSAHLLPFRGTDSLPAIEWLEWYYDGAGINDDGNGPIGVSVPATEHSVMCAGGQADELETFNRLLDLYPKGFVSVVSDTWDFWHVIRVIIPQLKQKILARDGRLVIRPDSGDPVKILTGDSDATDPLARMGLIEALWEIFGGTHTSKGYKVLDPHIGAIYGDSITPERAFRICELLERKGFASTNVVFGVGSYTYQYVTRDTYGWAIKATWCLVGEEERLLQKDPKTDSGVKKSAKGRIILTLDKHNTMQMVDNLSLAEWNGYFDRNESLYIPTWADGKFLNRTNVAELRSRINYQVAA